MCKKASVAVLGIALFASGCAGMSGPNWFNPGPTAIQQSRAERFDPYPENDAGPAVVGARPREFEKGIAEPSRARWNPRTWAARFGL